MALSDEKRLGGFYFGVDSAKLGGNLLFSPGSFPISVYEVSFFSSVRRWFDRFQCSNTFRVAICFAFTFTFSSFALFIFPLVNW